MVDMNIINGKVFFGNKLIESGLSINDGKIIAIGKEEHLPVANEILDVSDRIVLPGCIDVHTHILDLIYSYREDFVSGTQAAASGGVTTILEMPLGIEGHSVLDVFEMQSEIIRKKSIIDYGLIGAAGYSSIDSISELAKRGVLAFKTFMINPSEEEAELQDLAAHDDSGLNNIFSEIAETKLISCVHAEDDDIITGEIARLSSLGKVDFRAHTESRPPISEDEACRRAIFFAKQTNVKLHLVHMSSKNAFTMIHKAKNSVDITCEITPHHLFLTDKDGIAIGPWAKVDPPLRGRDHVKKAWEALNNGTIDMVASDHSPYSDEEKLLGENNSYFEIGSGTTGIETSFPLILDAYNKGRLSLKKLVEVLSTNPAKRFGLYPQKGIIAVNADADLVIVDLKEEYNLKNEDLFTHPKISIFHGKKLKGRVEKTLVRGKVVYNEGDILVTQGTGKFLSPQASQNQYNNGNST
ncbi:MAG: dihydroorotase [Candidatus Hodarchaeales archaeon]